MKTLNLKKVLIPSFALLIGGSLAASVSSTLAWFQYATRAQLAYVGSLNHCSKLLKISINNSGVWGNEFSQSQMATYIGNKELIPITTGVKAKDEALGKFYKQPNYGAGGYANWSEATSSNYVQFTIKVRVNDVDGNQTPARLVNDVYITKFVIEDDSTNGTGSDLSDAIRVHLAVTDAEGTRYFLFAKNVESTAVGGKLDLNNDGAYDKDLDSWGATDCIYGTADGTQTSYKINNANLIVADPDNPVANTTPTSIGKTGAADMTIVVTTWIEGWAKLDHGLTGNANGASDSAIWDPLSYINKKFNVGIRLGVKSHDTDHQS